MRSPLAYGPAQSFFCPRRCLKDKRLQAASEGALHAYSRIKLKATCNTWHLLSIVYGKRWTASSSQSGPGARQRILALQEAAEPEEVDRCSSSAFSSRRRFLPILRSHTIKSSSWRYCGAIEHSGSNEKTIIFALLLVSAIAHSCSTPHENSLGQQRDISLLNPPGN